MSVRIVALLTVAALVAGASLCFADWEAGLAAFGRGDYEEAAREIKKYVETNPTDPRYAIAYYMLGSSYVQLGQTEAAADNLRTAVELDPGRVDYRLALGQFLITTGEYVEADSVLNELESSAVPEEQRISVALLRAKASLELGEADDAVEVLEALLPTANDSADLHRALGVALLRSNARERAFTEFAFAYELDPSDSNVGRSAVNLALDLAEDQSTSEAKELWQVRGFELAELLATAEPTPRYMALAGDAAFRAGRFEDAATWLQKAYEADPDNPLLGYDLGRSLASLGQYEEALRALADALEAQRDDDLTVRIHRQMAKISAWNLELDAASRHFRLAGDEQAAAQIGDLAASFREALDTRRGLLAKISELRKMEKELEELNDVEGVEAVRGRADALQAELDALEANLETVRQALKNL